MRKHITLICSLLLALPLSAQDLSRDFKNWYLVNTNLRFNKKNTLSIGHLSSFDVQGYQHRFHQNRLTFNHKLTQAWTIGAGYSYSVIRGNTKNTPYHRFEAQLSHRVRWGHYWRMTNSLRLEKYAPQLAKFGARALLTNKIQYYNRKWPFRFSPYIRNQVFYYQGGREQKYWLDPEKVEDGEDDFVLGAPNGWHRYRFSVGARMRLRKNLNLTLFYTLQREFNTGLSPYTALNIPNKSQTRTKLPFNNYSLLGLSLSYTIKFY